MAPIITLKILLFFVSRVRVFFFRLSSTFKLFKRLSFYLYNYHGFMTIMFGLKSSLRLISKVQFLFHVKVGLWSIKEVLAFLIAWIVPTTMPWEWCMQDWQSTVRRGLQSIRLQEKDSGATTGLAI